MDKWYVIIIYIRQLWCNSTKLVVCREPLIQDGWKTGYSLVFWALLVPFCMESVRCICWNTCLRWDLRINSLVKSDFQCPPDRYILLVSLMMADSNIFAYVRAASFENQLCHTPIYGLAFIPEAGYSRSGSPVSPPVSSLNLALKLTCRR